MGYREFLPGKRLQRPDRGRVFGVSDPHRKHFGVIVDE
jgi:hypothetical protein